MEVIGVGKVGKVVENKMVEKTDQQQCSGSEKAGSKDVTELDVDRSTPLRNTPLRYKPVWEGTEEEQMEWALAESAKSAEKESTAKLKVHEQETNYINGAKCTTEETALSEDSNFDSEDFNLMSDMSDEDLVNMAQESAADQPVGLKGGAPITTAAQDLSVDLDDNCLNDTGSSKSCGEDSSLEHGLHKGFVLKNSTPKIGIKRRNGSSVQKQKLQRNVSLNKTPSLGKFEGDLFDYRVKEEKASLNSASRSDGIKKSSWDHTVFSDEDMERAINMSLQDQVRIG